MTGAALAVHDRRWSAFHIHWPGALEPVLVRAVAPLVADLEASGRIDGFFFVRYWEGGQHLRLRLRRGSSRVDGELERRVYEDLERRLGPLTAQAVEAPDGHAAAGHVLRRPYEPEVFRYGGPRGLAVAETCFEGSSRGVLHWLQGLEGVERPTPEPDARVRDGFAAALLAVSAHAFGLDRTAACSFLEAVADDGLRQVRAPGAPAAATWPSEERLREAFGAGYARQREAVGAQMAAVWHAAGAGELGPLQAWHDLYSNAGAGMLDVWRSGEVEGNPANRWKTGKALGAACWPVAGILFDLLHMTQNRLGVGNHDEIYLAWLVARALETTGAAP